MQEQKTTVIAADGMPLFHRRTMSADTGRGVVFLGHSQPTHSGNLSALATGLAERGWDVHSGDLRGHGRSTSRALPLGHLPVGEGWDGLKRDLAAHLDAAFAGVAFRDRLLVAPNITALLALDLLATRPDLAARIVLISPPPNQRAIHALACGYAKARLLIHPADRPDEKTLHTLYSFLGAHLKSRDGLMAAVTDDPATTEALAADPLAWPVPTLGYWHEIFEGHRIAWQRLEDARADPGTRILLLTGSQDPMVAGGRVLGPMIRALEDTGAEVEARRIPGGRSGFFLDAGRHGLAEIVDQWAAGRLSRGPEEATATLPMDEIASGVLDQIGSGPETGDTDTLVALCYSAIEDEDRWVEIMYRLVHRLSADGNEAEHLAELETVLNVLMPHWDRSWRINRQLMERAAVTSVMQSVLERFDMGLAVVNSRVEVLHRNEVFERMMDARLGPGGALSARLPKDFVARIRAGEKEAVLTLDGRPSGFYFRPPVLKEAVLRQAGATGVLALLPPREAHGEDRTERLDLIAFALGLTRRETEVATRLADGSASADVAAKLGISMNTLKTHLKRIYAKLGIGSQVELATIMRSNILDWVLRSGV